MAKTTNCDFCGAPGAKTGAHEKKVLLPVEFCGVKTARVQIHIYATDGRLTMPDTCDKCAEAIAAAPAFVPVHPETKPA